jgi:hypothetical protein
MTKNLKAILLESDFLALRFKTAIPQYGFYQKLV